MSEAPTYLDRILAAKRAALQAGRHDRAAALTDAQLEAELATLRPCRDFARALRDTPMPRIIAEFKRASPSQGAIREQADVVAITQGYERAGAAAVSVLADAHFDGRPEDVQRAAAALSIPVLWKDFIISRGQILEARRAGADAVLLIAAALPPPQLQPLIEFAHDIGMQVVCEVHDEYEADRAMSAGGRIIGGNARDLRDFSVDLQRAVDLRRCVPASFVYVAESGVRGIDDVRRLCEAGVDGILMGTTLMAAEDPGQALADLLAAWP